MKLLVGFYAFGSAEVNLGFTIGTVKQSRKQTPSAHGGVSSAVFAQFLNSIESVFIDDGFLGIWYDLPFFFWVMNRLVYLVTSMVLKLTVHPVYYLFAKMFSILLVVLS